MTKKRKRNGAKKGSPFEREISVLLSEWWSGALCRHVRQDIFWRSTTSGARATTRGKKGKKTAGHNGDICAIDPIGNPFLEVVTLELKCGYSKKEQSVAGLLDPPGEAKQEYEEFFEKANTSANAAGSLSWLLITRRDRRRVMATMPCVLFRRLDSMTAGHDWKPFAEIIAARGKWHVVVVSLKDFLKNFTPQMFIDIAKSI